MWDDDKITNFDKIFTLSKRINKIYFIIVVKIKIYWYNIKYRKGRGIIKDERYNNLFNKACWDDWWKWN